MRLPLPRRAPAILGVVAVLLATVALATSPLLRDRTPAVAASRNDVRILVGEPSTFDPAAQDDAATAAITAQIWETLTVFDAGLTLQPALAQSWDISENGRQVVFHLRPNLTFSDGTPLGAADVVGSWLRVIDPKSPSHLWSLVHAVHNAPAYVAGTIRDAAQVGIRASGNDVIVDLDTPASDFPAIVAAPLFGVVPPAVWRDGKASFGAGAVVSGGYRVTNVSSAEITLQANDRYWAGTPAVRTVHLVTDIGGRNPVVAFTDGDLDYTTVSEIDASWIPYDRDLGPQLRRIPTLDLTYFGFDTRRAPFDDVRVRQAVGAAVDWRHVVSLGSFNADIPADSMVPPGIPGAGDANWLPKHDPDAARRLLAEAGYPGGAGFPVVEFAASGGGPGAAIAADLERELGIKSTVEYLVNHFDRLQDDTPAMWTAGWIADYPGPNDFLGVLLGSTGSSNYTGWATPAFDQAIQEALSATDAAAAQRGFEKALAEVQREVPAVPLSYGTSWALSRDGLLGAGQNSLGLLRVAGMAWR